MGSRRRRLLKWFLPLSAVAGGITALVIVAGGSSPPPAGSELVPAANVPAQPKPRRLTAADRREINTTLDSFVNHAVKRRNVAASYRDVTPALIDGLSRAEWSRGDIPVYPFPAVGRRFHQWNLQYANSEEVGMELMLHSGRRSKLGSIMFHVYLKPVRGKWLVDSFLPAATFAPAGDKPKVTAVADFNPGPQGEPETSRHGAGRVGQAYLLVPFVLMGLLLGGLAAWGIVRRVRDRRLAGAYDKDLPPLPPRYSRRSAA